MAIYECTLCGCQETTISAMKKHLKESHGKKDGYVEAKVFINMNGRNN
jgi:hypothetical protein